MAKKDIIEVSAWHNSKPTKTGAGYGIRVPKEHIMLVKNWEQIKFLGNQEYEILNRNNRKDYTDKCPEIRSKLIGLYLIKEELTDWQPKKPPKLKLKNEGEGVFTLSKS